MRYFGARRFGVLFVDVLGLVSNGVLAYVKSDGRTYLNDFTAAFHYLHNGGMRTSEQTRQCETIATLSAFVFTINEQLVLVIVLQAGR